MCRHLAYIGRRKKTLNNLILDPDHSLLKQSFMPKELKEATINADGFGIGWIMKNNLPGIYKNSLPIWSDQSLKYVGNSISSNIIIANVRSATPGQGYGHQNIHPFIFKNMLFSHNGYINNYNNIRNILIKKLDKDFLNNINGNTDSESIFALICQNISNGDDVKTAIFKTFNLIKEISNDALLNIIIIRKFGSNKEVYATRYAIGKTPPSLYILNLLDTKQESAVIASEALDNKIKWNKIPSSTYIQIQNTSLLTQSII